VWHTLPTDEAFFQGSLNGIRHSCTEQNTSRQAAAGVWGAPPGNSSMQSHMALGQQGQVGTATPPPSQHTHSALSVTLPMEPGLKPWPAEGMVHPVPVGTMLVPCGMAVSAVWVAGSREGVVAEGAEGQASPPGCRASGQPAPSLGVPALTWWPQGL